MYLIKHEIIAPATMLRSFVQYFWTLKVERSTTNESPIRTFVDDSSGIVMEFALDPEGYFPKRTMVYGQTTTPTENRDNPSFLALGVLLHPAAIHELFGMNAHELTNQKIQLDEFSRTSFTDIISSKKSIPDIIQVLSAYFAAKIADVKGQDTFIRHCIQHIKNRVEMVTVKELCDCYNISERQLERKFLTTIGVTPRHYIKTIRFKKALTLIAGKSFNKLSDIAYQLNYFDQAHFIRQTKDLSGLNPKLLQSQMNIKVANIIL
ncbi:helix-turn-helix domain-containing protein [Chitinophaga sp. CCNWLW40]|uniref:helix-turn-helix domain-containing protein n=1 Tax=Chitinophaga sp. CCNWLW40 TaxID=3122070 RepID=UPI00300F8ECE